MKKRYCAVIGVLTVLCLGLILWSAQLMRTLSLYPVGDKIYEKTEDDATYSITRYELENDFVIMCTYKDDSIIDITVHNSETNTTGTAFSNESAMTNK